MPKSGFVAIVGRPNVGKSTLLNRLIGEKVAIVSPVPQTTRNQIRGILNRSEGQVIFVDTPGIHQPKHRLNERMMKQVHAAFDGLDLVLFMTDAASSRNEEEFFAFDLVRKKGIPSFLLLNKIDLIRKERLLPLIQTYAGRADWKEIIPVSAQTGDGVDLLIHSIFAVLKEGPPFFPPDQYTDQPERDLVVEFIREKIMLNTRQEIPHSVAVIIDRYEETPALVRIYASILVERESQKGIVIGQKGSMLKRIGSEARRDIERLLNTKIYLELFVKVRVHWRDDEAILDEIKGNRRES
ncbi:MAG: GTPase Era [Acidobacteriia bacterium]|nr:GTPase Era [Terriglobia bacterium]